MIKKVPVHCVGLLFGFLDKKHISAPVSRCETDSFPKEHR